MKRIVPVQNTEKMVERSVELFEQVTKAKKTLKILVICGLSDKPSPHGSIRAD